MKVIGQVVRKICRILVFRTFFLSYVYFRHIESISGVLKIDFSTFCGHSFSSIQDGVFSYHYSGYWGLRIDPQNAKNGSFWIKTWYRIVVHFRVLIKKPTICRVFSWCQPFFGYFHPKIIFLRKNESKIRIKSHPMSTDHSLESESPVKSTCKRWILY